MEDTNTYNSKKLLIRWVILTALVMFFGIIISFVIAFFVISLLESFLNVALAYAIGFSIIGGGIGALIGWLQWMLLRKKITLSANWILLSAGGLAISELVAGLALWAIGSNRDLATGGQSILIYTLIYTIGGALVGSLQRPVLEKNSSISHLWVYACALGWGLTFMLLLLSTEQDHLIKTSLMFIAGCLVMGIITGIAVIKMLDEKKLAYITIKDAISDDGKLG